MRHGYNTWLIVIDGESYQYAGYEHEIQDMLVDVLGYELFNADVQVYIL
jgi:hypothetical protein